MVSMDSVAAHRDFTARSEQLGRSDELRSLALWFRDALPEGRLDLLARDDASLMVASAIAVLRLEPTFVERAAVGRTGWTPRDGAILVEAVPPSPGLLRTLSRTFPDLQVLVAPAASVEDAVGMLAA